MPKLYKNILYCKIKYFRVVREQFTDPFIIDRSCQIAMLIENAITAALCLVLNIFGVAD